MDEEIDYKKLLQKYMDHVDECEGSDFLNNIESGNKSSIEFTEQEIKELRKL